MEQEQTDFDLSTFVTDTTKGDNLLDLLMNGLKLIKDHIDHKIDNNCKKIGTKFAKGHKNLYDQYIYERKSLCNYLLTKLGIYSIGFKHYYYCECMVVIIRFLTREGNHFPAPNQTHRIRNHIPTSMIYLNILPFNSRHLFSKDD
jgi:hypothetical protein